MNPWKAHLLIGAWIALETLAASCATSSQQQAADPSPHEYGGLREPTEFHKKDDPVVPPIAAPVEAPRKDPCVPLCAAFNANDRECDRLSEACDKMFREQGHMNGETCTKKEGVCKRVVTTKTNLGSCNCE